MGLTTPQRRPLETIEALNDHGLEAIRTNFDTLFNDTVVQADSFALTAADVNALLATYSSGYLKNVSGTLTIQAAPIPAADGGTGFAGYTVGDLLYADSATTLARLADVATGRVLVSGGIGAAPAYSATPTVTTLFVGNGSAAAPAVAPASDTNTGIYFNGADGFFVSTGGTERVAVASDGGITATSSAAVALSLVNASGPVLQLSGAGRDTIQIVSAASGSSIIKNVSNSTLLFGSNNTAGAQLDTSQNWIVVGQVQSKNGTAGSPGFSSSADTNTGIFFDGSDTIRFSLGGTERANVRSGGQWSLTPFSAGADQGFFVDTTNLANGSNAIFVSSPTGWTGNQFKGNFNGVEIWGIDHTGRLWATTLSVNTTVVTSGLKLDVSGVMGVANGTAGAPTYTSRSDTNTGIYFNGTDSVFISTGGVQCAQFDGSQNVTVANNLVITGQAQAKTGTAGSPSYAASSDGNTGIYFDGADALFFSNNGTESARFTSTGVFQLASGKNLKFQGTGLPDFAATATGTTTCTLGTNSPSGGTTPNTWIKCNIAGAGTFYIPAFT